MATTLTVSDSIVQGSPLAAVNDGTHVVLLYQRSEGVFRVFKEPLKAGGRTRKQGTDISTITGSPIVPIVVRDEKQTQINVFYIDQDFTLTERTDLLGQGNTKKVVKKVKVAEKDTWVPAKANPVAGLAAIVHYEEEGVKAGAKVEPTLVPHTSVFYQDFETNKIYRLTRKRGGTWGEPEIISVVPLVVTSLAAAVSAKGGQGKIHLYYQHKDITLREAVLEDKKWVEGDFRPGNIALQSPLATLVVEGKVLVFYRELSGTSFVGDDSGPSDGAITTDITDHSSFKHAAVQVGQKLRFYYQDEAGSLKCLTSDLNGKDWAEER